jgi:hypothetical protein
MQRGFIHSANLGLSGVFAAWRPAVTSVMQKKLGSCKKRTAGAL